MIRSGRPGFAGRSPAAGGPRCSRRAAPAACRADDQEVEVGVPAGADAEHRAAVGQAAVDQGQQHLVALRSELDRDVAAVLPGEAELMRRVELGDAALHPVLDGKPRRPLAGRIGQLVVAPDEFERRADFHLHPARRQPLAAQIALREIGPDALDRAGQKALDLERGGLGQHAIGFLGRVFVHRSSPFGGVEVRRESPREAGVRAHRGGRSRSARRSRAIRGRWRAARARGGRDGCGRAPRDGSILHSPVP